MRKVKLMQPQLKTASVRVLPASARRGGIQHSARETRRCRGVWAVSLLCLATAVASHGQFKTLYSFKGTANGELPNSPPVQGFDGNLYALISTRTVLFDGDGFA